MSVRNRSRWVGASRVTVAVLSAMVLVPSLGAAKDAVGTTQTELPEPVLGSLESAFEVYEEIRGLLVADELEGVPASASRLAGTFRLALKTPDGLDGSVPGVIEEAALHAQSLAEADDLTVARTAFGEVSRSLLLLASYDSRMTEGRYVFKCPMVTEFGKWIQPTEVLENPYMGPAMPKCGFASDWSIPAAVAEAEPWPPVRTAEPSNAESSTSEPTFTPGIPGIEMVDVRDFRFLWREIEELQRWERGDRISVDEYRSKSIEKTVHFLELEGAEADSFTAVAAAEIAKVRSAFSSLKQTSGNLGGADAPFSSRLREAASRLADQLAGEPRHQLFVPESKKWLLKLAFGPTERKETSEVRQADVELP